MSKSIQDAFDLPLIEDLLKSSKVEESVGEDDPNTQLATALGNGMVTKEVVDERQATDHANSMDEIHQETLQHAKDLMDLGFNVDTRSAKGIFDNAANMFKLALDAKNSKRQAQLKQAKLLLDERRVIIDEKSKPDSEGQVVDGEAVVVVEDRNTLIKEMLEMKKK